MAKPIGLLGGTFDPVHNGHIRLALEILTRLNLSGIRMIPLNIPPHRNMPIASKQHRLQMLLDATRHIDGLSVDEREINREDTSWTIDTVRSVRTELPDTSLCLIMGKDAFLSFDSWKDWEQITDYVHLVIASRNFAKKETYTDNIQRLLSERSINDHSQLLTATSGYIYQIDIPLLDISSTQIRESLARQQAVDSLLPNSTLHYLNKHHLYQ